MRVRIEIALLCVLVLVAGCGRRMAITPGQAPRVPATGDTAKYVTKVLTGFDNSQFRKDTSDTMTVETGTLHSDAVPAGLTGTYDVKHVMETNTGSQTIITWYGEDAQNNTYLLGMSGDGEEWDLVTDSTLPMVCPGSLAVGTSWIYTANLASGIIMSSTCKVVGKEWLSTDAGKFETYKVEEQAVTEISGLLGSTKVNTNRVTWVSPQVYTLVIQSEQKSDVGQMGGEETRKMHLKELKLVETARS